MRGSSLGRGGRAKDRRGLFHLGLSEGLSLLRGSRLLLLPLLGDFGYLCQRRLLEGGRLEGLVWGGGATGDGGAQECIQVGAAAQDGGGRGRHGRGGGNGGRDSWGDGLCQNRDLLGWRRPGVWRGIKESSKLHVLVVDELEHV